MAKFIGEICRSAVRIYRRETSDFPNLPSGIPSQYKFILKILKLSWFKVKVGNETIILLPLLYTTFPQDKLAAMYLLFRENKIFRI